MIGLHPEGRTITGFEQFKARFARVLTTLTGTRERHREKGSNARKYDANNNDDSTLMKLQSEVMSSMMNPSNQLTDYQVERCVASRTSTGVSIALYGKYLGSSANFEVPFYV